MVVDDAAPLATRLDDVSHPPVARSAWLPPSLKICVLSMGVSEQRQDRLDMADALVQLRMDAATAILQLNDPERFNTFSICLGEDARRAVEHVYALSSVASLCLMAAGMCLMGV